MEIKTSKEKDLMMTISIEIKAEDYTEKVDMSLRNYRKTVQIPGFRKGKTPLGIINKKYRTSVVVEEVNRLIQDELYKYITGEKLRVLGSPMPINSDSIDWKNDKDFCFQYEVGLAPKFDVKITSKDKLDYYRIKADSKLINNYCNDIAKRYGKMSNAKVSSEGDLIYCSIEQLDDSGKIISNGIKNDATVSMDYIADLNIRKQFLGLKKDDIVKLNVLKSFTNRTDLLSMLNVSQVDIQNLVSEVFQFTVKNINRLEPAKLDTVLFDKVYGAGSVKTDKDFKLKVKDEAERQFITESDRMLKNDVVNYLIEKLKLEMPNEFLKRWLVKTSDQPITMEILEKEYDTYSKSLQWQLIENKIIEKYEINVSQDDIMAHAKSLIKIQMQQYGQLESDDKQLTEIANNILKNEEEKKKIYNQIFDERTLIVYKQNFKLNEKSISYNDFVKLASEKS